MVRPALEKEEDELMAFATPSEVFQRTPKRRPSSPMMRGQLTPQQQQQQQFMQHHSQQQPKLFSIQTSAHSLRSPIMSSPSMNTPSPVARMKSTIFNGGDIGSPNSAKPSSGNRPYPTAFPVELAPTNSNLKEIDYDIKSRRNTMASQINSKTMTMSSTQSKNNAHRSLFQKSQQPPLPDMAAKLNAANIPPLPKLSNVNTNMLSSAPQILSAGATMSNIPQNGSPMMGTPKIHTPLSAPHTGNPLSLNNRNNTTTRLDSPLMNTPSKNNTTTRLDSPLMNTPSKNNTTARLDSSLTNTPSKNNAGIIQNNRLDSPSINTANKNNDGMTPNNRLDSSLIRTPSKNIDSTISSNRLDSPSINTPSKNNGGAIPNSRLTVSIDRFAAATSVYDPIIPAIPPEVNEIYKSTELFDLSIDNPYLNESSDDTENNKNNSFTNKTTSRKSSKDVEDLNNDLNKIYVSHSEFKQNQVYKNGQDTAGSLRSLPRHMQQHQQQQPPSPSNKIPPKSEKRTAQEPKSTHNTPLRVNVSPNKYAQSAPRPTVYGRNDSVDNLEPINDFNISEANLQKQNKYNRSIIHGSPFQKSTTFISSPPSESLGTPGPLSSDTVHSIPNPFRNPDTRSPNEDTESNVSASGDKALASVDQVLSDSNASDKFDDVDIKNDNTSVMSLIQQSTQDLNRSESVNQASISESLIDVNHLKSIFHRADIYEKKRLYQYELLEALTFFDESLAFDLSSIKMFIKVFDKSAGRKKNSLNYSEFAHLCKNIVKWKHKFLEFAERDEDESEYSIIMLQFQDILLDLGYQFEKSTVDFIFEMFSSTGDSELDKEMGIQEMELSKFIECMAWLNKATSIFRRFDVKQNGIAVLPYDEFIHEIFGFKL